MAKKDEVVAQVANTKLTREEMDEIQAIQKDMQNITFSLGTLEVQAINLAKQKDEMLGHLAETNTRDKDFGGKLFEKYGKGRIDFEKGEFIKADDSEE